jgi:hypothetical protein
MRDREQWRLVVEEAKAPPGLWRRLEDPKPNRLMLFRETIAVYCENHTEHTNTLCGKVKLSLSLTN